jgi:Domain of unknown function (DUF5658)
MALRDLLILNLLLQVFDGTASYFILSSGVLESNPLVESAIEFWGLVWGLLFWKLFSCVLLFLLYSIRIYREPLAVAALGFSGAIYSCLTVVLVWRWVEMLLT